MGGKQKWRKGDVLEHPLLKQGMCQGFYAVIVITRASRERLVDAAVIASNESDANYKNDELCDHWRKLR